MRKKIQWTKEQQQRVSDWLDRGMSYTAIAKRLHCTAAAVELAVDRFGIRRFSRRKQYLNPNAIAIILGMSRATISKWINTRGLPAFKSDWRTNAPIRIDWMDLMQWLEEPLHWPLYDPEACTEPALREHLIEIRQGQPRWLTTHEVAKRLLVSRDSVARWCFMGILPNICYREYFIRDSDLDGFIIPCERSK